VGSLMVSEGRWVKIALVAVIAIVVGSTMMVTSYRGHEGDSDRDRCRPITAAC